MGRNLLAAAAALSLFVMPAAAFGQGTGQADATPALATTDVTPLSIDAQIANLRSEDARRDVANQLSAQVGLPLFGVTSNNNTLPQFSWGIPRSPALTLAGLADTKVPTSDSLRSFVVSLPTTLNNDE